MQAELKRAREREKMNEDHNTRLSATIDKLLTESNERLQAHLKERMSALEEKTAVTQELDHMKLQVDELQKDKEVLAQEFSRIKEEKRQSQELNKELVERARQSMGLNSSSSPVDVQFREQRGRQCVEENPSQVFTLNEQEWQKMEQENVLKNITLAFDTRPSDTGDLDYENEESEVAGDALTLASLLQQQIDAINLELNYLQDEHRNTEEKTDELVKSASSTSIGGPRRLSGANEDYNSSSFPFPPLDPMDTTPIWVKSSKDGSLHTLNDDSPTPPTPSSVASDSTESPKTSMTSPVPDVISAAVSSNGNTKLKDNSNDSLPSVASTSTTSSAESLSKTGQSTKKKGIKGSFGRLFGSKSKGRNKETTSSQDSDSVSLDSATSGNRQRELDRSIKKKSHLLAEALEAGTPFGLWNAPTVVAWLELWVGMPAWYVAACQANVKSGAIMSALSDTEIQHEIGISNPLHRVKLRLAIQEIITLTTPSSPHTNRNLMIIVLVDVVVMMMMMMVVLVMMMVVVKMITIVVMLVILIMMVVVVVIMKVVVVVMVVVVMLVAVESLVYGEMNHDWVANEWLPHIGLSQYKTYFEECLVDARMLEHISKKEYQKYLKVVDSFH
ncbi:hypothetical protein QZH41_020378, partial [Actinostola sp. cb2023]